MALLVQKYGGTSVADSTRIVNVAKRIVSATDSGNQVVAVVSAMGNTTDRLIELAHEITSEPSPRELDFLLSTGEIVSCTLLAMALRELGAQAISLSGAQAGIQTDASHSRARIEQVETGRVLGELGKGNIVIVAGFQGMTTEMETTTLGRGGSDTTAVALAAALEAERCEIYTDVPGVFTADPRVVPNARKLVDLSFEEMLELASYGAGVLHPRSVELGAFYGIPILVASSFSREQGTLIHGGEPMESRNRLSGIAHDLDTAKITVVGIPDRPGIAASLFEPLARAGISVDTIVQNASEENITDLTFTVARRDLAASQEIVSPVAENLGGRGIVANGELGKVSIVGNGMQDAPGYAARMFTALYRAGINIQMITTSEIRITCIVDRSDTTKAVQVLYDAFYVEGAEL